MSSVNSEASAPIQETDAHFGFVTLFLSGQRLRYLPPPDALGPVQDGRPLLFAGSDGAGVVKMPKHRPRPFPSIRSDGGAAT